MTVSIASVGAFKPARTSPMVAGYIDGGGSGKERVDVWDAADGSVLTIYAIGRLNSEYAGGGLTCAISLGRAAGTSAQNVRVRMAIRRLDTAEDFDTTDHTYDYNASDVAVATSVGPLVTATITFTNGADMDSLAAGEPFVVAIQREGNHANDTLTADARFWTDTFEISETGT